MTTWTAPAAEIAANYAPAYPWFPDRKATWDDAVASLTATESDRKRLAELEDDLLLNGQQEPVRLHPGGCDPNDEECTGTCCPPVILNGMHRVVNALLANRDITVTTDKHVSSDGPVSATDIYTYTDIDLFDGIFDYLSFRVHDNLWANTSVMASRPTGVVIYWDDDMTGYEDVIETKLRKVLREAGVESSVSIVTYQEDFDD